MTASRFTLEILKRVRSGELTAEQARVAALTQRGAGRARGDQGPMSSSSETHAAPSELRGEPASSEAVAVIGMACRFPGASDVEAFWQKLRNGQDAFREVPEERWALEEFYDPDPDAPMRSTCRRGAFLDDPARFDAALFRLTADDARLMDPQQRLFLEIAWSALQNAGYLRCAEPRPVAVVVGARASSYAHELRAAAPQRKLGRADILGYSQNYMAAWVADRLNLTGPALVVDTACSSSLVAIHLACRSLLSAECEMAIAGGVDLLLSPSSYVYLSKAKVLSASGVCRPFHEDADGYVPGEGAGAVVLKRLTDAVRDNDSIYAVIRGSHMNNDGRTIGITTPNVSAQVAAIRGALRAARWVPSSLSYVEAHGTGTTIGDPIEMRALHEVFGDSTEASFCGIGSVKSNIGHLHSAAGVAGLIKTVLCLDRGMLVPTLNCERPNPRFDFDRSPFFLSREARPWAGRDGVRRAGVSSFGFGGTNCHVVLEQAPPIMAAAPAVPAWLYVSANTPTALRSLGERLAAHIEARTDHELGDIGFTLAAGREQLPYRCCVVASRSSDAAKLRDAAAAPSSRRSAAPDVVFLFPGQGTQSHAMCRDVYERFAAFREAIEVCADAFAESGVRLLDILYGSDHGRALDVAAPPLVVQPALFAIEYALARLYQGWGVQPAAVIGHSLGEYAAACVAGVMSVGDAVRLVAARARGVEQLPEPGRMCVALAPEADVVRWLPPRSERVALAAVNGDRNCTLAGGEREIAELERVLNERGISTVPLRVSHAYHSPLMTPMLPPFRRELEAVSWNAPTVTWISNLTGRPQEGPPSAERWLAQLTQTVRFADGVRHLAASGYRTFVEVGPEATLCRLVRDLLGSEPVVRPSWRRDGGLIELMETAAELANRGSLVDGRVLHASEGRRRVALPDYPFEGDRYPLRASVAQPSDRIAPGAPEVEAHRIFGQPTLPATAIWLRALAAARAKLGVERACLRKVVLLRPLRVHEELELDVTWEDGGRFTVSAAVLGGRREPAVGGEAHPSSGMAPAALDVNAIARGCSRAVAGASLYDHFSKLGYAYGPLFRTASSVAVGEGVLVAELAVDPSAPFIARQAALMDGALQALVTLADSELEGRQFLPFAVDGLTQYRPIPSIARAVAEREPGGPGAERFRVRIVDVAGERCVDIDGYTLRQAVTAPAPAAAREALPALTDTPTSVPTFEVVWRGTARMPNAELERSAPAPRGRALVFADAGPFARALIDALTEAGSDVVCVVPAERFEARSSRLFGIRPDVEGDYAQLREAMERSGVACSCVFHCWLVAAPRAPERELALGLRSYRALFRAFGDRPDLSVQLLTHGACAHRAPVLLAERAAAVGLARVAALEYRNLEVRLLDVEGVLAEDARSALLSSHVEVAEAALRGGELFAPELERRTFSVDGASPLREGGRYLITGGASGIGLELCRHLARRYRAWIGIVGRTRAELRAAELRELEQAGGRPSYACADVADGEELARAVAQFRRAAGGIDGVFHLAGVLRDGLLRSTGSDSLEHVLRPKLLGARHLRAATLQDRLDFFVLYGSMSAVLGNPGQADYAAANASLGALAHELRRGGTPALCVDWSLWDETGFGSRGGLLAAARSGGVRPIAAQAGIATLERAIASGAAQLMLADFDPGTLERLLSRRSWRSLERAEPAAPRSPAGANTSPGGHPAAAVAALLVPKLEALGGIGIEKQDSRTFLEMGLDSAALVRVVRELEQALGVPLYPTLLFEYPTVDALTAYLAERYPSEVARALQASSSSQRASAVSSVSTSAAFDGTRPSTAAASSNGESHHIAHEGVADNGAAPNGAAHGRAQYAYGSSSERSSTVSSPADTNGAIAIVGMAGRFPGAPNLEQLWRNLRAGRDSITEVPPSRFDSSVLFDPKPGVPGKIYSKWGGVVDGVDAFDPLFFNVSPREAALMDPQQRIFLEVAWEAIENAGRGPRSLAGSDVGVFVGATYNNYFDELREAGVEVDAHVALGNSRAILPNRVSHFFDFRGPSFYVDTLCSSSLLSVQLACDSLRRGACSLALAGGVYLMLGASYYRILSRMKVLSPSGRCKTFDASADGYVPGEGVAALLLKPLKQALADRDPIHAVLRGGAINHDGHSSSLTAPNPQAQRDVLLRAWSDAGVEPDDLGYIEAHGTGTSLGDPIEVTALSSAFRQRTNRRQFCAIGSIKTNIGHLEPAAGIAGIIKVALALAHREIPPSMHFERPNPFIPFIESPFLVPDRVLPWPRGPRPRRAGVSSFGMGGANAHLVLEEAPTERFSSSNEVKNTRAERHAVVLSARSERALLQQVRQLAAFLRGRTDAETPRLGDVAYTLALGRDAWSYRLGWVVGSIDELCERMAEHLTDPLNGARGDRARTSGARSSELEQVLELWSGGATVDWDRQYRGTPCRRISLPSYPFERETCWFEPRPPQPSLPAEPLPSAGAIQTLSAPLGPEDIASLVRAITWNEARLEVLEGAVPNDTLIIGTGAVAEGLALELRAEGRGATVCASGQAERDALVTAARGAIVYLVESASGAESTDEREARELELAVDRFFELIKRLATDPAIASRRLWVISRSAHASGDRLEHSRRAAAVVAGLARTFGSECASWSVRIIDIDGSIGARDAAALVRAELAAAGPMEVSYRGGRRLAAQVSSVPKSEQRGSADWFVPHGVYWITGGTGGLGLQVAEWLAGRGPVQLVLHGSRVLPPESEWTSVLRDASPGHLVAERIRRIERVRALGATVVYEAGDVADRAAMEAIERRIWQRWGRLDGVFHAAGIVADGFLRTKERAAMRTVLAPKIEGLRLLDQITQSRDLRIFVAFSSLASLSGNQGQADYVAANTYIDRYMSARASRGPGLSLCMNWGLWDGGMAISQQMLSRYRAAGLAPLSPELGTALLGWALDRGTSGQLAVADLSAAAWEELQARVAGIPRQSGAAGPPSADARSGDRTPVMTPPPPGEPIAAGHVEDDGATRALLVGLLSDKLRVPRERLQPHVKLADLGLDSFFITEIVDELSKRYGRPVHHAALLEHPTLGAFTAHLLREYGPLTAPARGDAAQADAARPLLAVPELAASAPTAPPSSRVAVRSVSASDAAERCRFAIVSIAGRFPEAPNVDAFWANLVGGRDVTGAAPRHRYDVRAGNAAGVRGAFLERIDEFDPEFFGFTAVDALLMDPQQRMFLELAEELFERSGWGTAGVLEERTGIFVGTRASGYHQQFRGELERALEGADIALSRSGIVGSLTNYIAAHVAQRYGLRGPSLVVDSACSSSLLAVHLACDAIARGDCDAAVAGGIDLKINLESHRYLDRMRATARDGKSRVFDAHASGFVAGEGGAAVLIRRLDRAIADRNDIYAVILGSAAGNDGRTMGATTPSLDGQIDVLERAYERAGISPESVSYVEAHGTGTPLGDPIEFKALNRVYRRRTSRSAFAAIGSVKSGVGHLDTAAGITGLVKTVLMLRHRTLVPTLNCLEPNPRFAFERSPFYIGDRCRPWPATGSPRRAAVSSFGFGGTNCHVVLEEPPEAVSVAGRPLQILALSAGSETALDVRRDALISWLSSPAAERATLADVCASANRGFSHRDVRLAVLASDTAELVERLRSAPVRRAGRPRVVFMFPGQGSQYAGMGQELDRAEPAFRKAIDDCDRIYQRLTGSSLRSWLFAERGSPRVDLDDTAFTQPAMFAVDYALARTWISFGVRPDAVIGHSLGEYVAACIAGALSLDDALNLVVTRARLMGALPAGFGMLAVVAPAEQLEQLLRESAIDAEIAAINGPADVVAAGPLPALEQLERRLREHGTRCVRLRVSHAFHSRQVEPLVGAIRRACAEIAPKAPEIPIARNLDASVSTDVLTADYWAAHLRNPVRFGPALEGLSRKSYDLLLEVGPGGSLARLAASCIQRSPVHVMSSLAHRAEERRSMLDALARLYELGQEIDWQQVHAADQPRAVALPTYPFERRRFWPAASPKPEASAPLASAPSSSEREGSGGTALQGIGSPMLDGCAASMPGRALYRKTFRATTDLCVAHHVVLGQQILPATGYWEMIVRAASHAFGQKVAALSGVTLAAPLVIAEGRAVEAQVVLDWPAAEQRPSRVSATVISRLAGAEPSHAGWTSHVSCSVQLGDPERGTALRLAELAAQLDVHFPPSASYTDEYAAASGICYGPWFRTLGAMQGTRSEVLASLRVPDAYRADAHRYSNHPAVVDGALQALAAVRLIGDHSDDHFVPMFVERVRFLRDVPADATSYGRLREAPEKTSEVLRADVDIATSDGELAVEVRGLLLKKIRHVPSARDASRATQIHLWQWQEEAATVVPSAPDGDWIVFGDSAGVCAGLARAVRQRGGRVYEVASGSRFQKLSEHRFRIDVESEADYARLVAELGPVLARGTAVVVHGFSCTPADRVIDTPELLALSQAEGARSVALLGRALALGAALPEHARLPVWILSTHAFHVHDGDPAGGAEKWTAAAMGRAISQEIPWFECRGVDLGDTPDAADWALLLADHARRPAHDALAYRGGRRFVRRLVRGEVEVRSLRLVEGATYLVTGGGRGLGWEVARHMARAARIDLVLLGRSPEPNVAGWREELAALGATASYCQVDVSRRQDLERLRASISARGGRIRGIVHAAGVIPTPCRFLDKSLDDFERVATPKIAGTWNLWQILGEGLDFLALFSSVSAAAPGLARGLSDYAVANAFLDGFAHEHAGGTTRVVSIGYSNWAEAGAGAGTAPEHSRGRLLRSLSTAEGLRAFDALVGSDLPHALVLEADLEQYDPLAPALDAVHQGQQGAVQPPALPAAQPAALAARAVGIEDDSPNGVFEAFLVAQVAAALRIPSERVDKRRTFMEQGVDSLALLGFSKELERRWSINVYPSVYFEHPTIDALARHLEREHSGIRAAGATPPGELPAATSVATRAAAHEHRRLLRHFMDNSITMRWSALGRLAPESLVRVVGLLVERHDLLRSIVQRDDRHVTIRVIERPQGAVVDYEDLRSLDDEAREAAVAERTEAHRRRRTGDGEWPLLRLTHLQLGERSHVLIMSVSHIICDGWSVSMLQLELQELCRRDLAGEPLELAPIRATYWDYVRALQARERDPGSVEARRYWEATFAEPLEALQLPTDFPRRADRDLRTDVVPIALDPASTWRVKETAKRMGVTLYVLIMAALCRRLFSWTGWRELVIGMPATGRGLRLPGIEQVFGCLVNVLPIRISRPRGDDVQALLQALSRSCSDALRFMDYPCPLELVPPLNFTFPHFSELRAASASAGEGIEFRTDQVFNDIGLHDVDFIFLAALEPAPAGQSDSRERLIFQWTYHASLYRRETVEGLASGLASDLEHFEPQTSLLGESVNDHTGEAR
jgi:acyl transferase domain-containing protein/acyl carrier protein